MSPTPSLTSPIRVVADGETSIDDEALAALGVQERTLEVVCTSGDRYEATWRGVALADLLERCEVPPETTHVLVESADGYRVSVRIDRALEALLAFERDGHPLSAAAGYDARFVAPGIGGPRAVKDVALIETVAIPPGAHPESYEELWPDD